MANNTRTIIEITDTHVKLLQARQTGGKVLVADFEVRPTADKLDEEIQSLVLQMLQERAITPEQFFLVLPRRLASIKRIRLPSLDEKEIRRMLSLQIPQMVPYGLEDVVYGYDILEKEKAGYSQLIVYIVHKDVSDRYNKIFEQAKAVPSKYVLSSQGVLGWFCLQKARNTGAAALVLNLDLVHAEACFVQDGQLLFSRAINSGVTSLRHEALEKFIDQVELSVRLYKKERFGADITRILVVASVGDLADVVSALDRRLHLPVECCSWREDLAADQKVMGRIAATPGLSLTVCLGLAALEPKSLINLIAKHVQDVKDEDVKRKHIFRFVVAAAFFFLAFIFWGSADLFFNLATLRQLERQAAGTGAYIKEAQREVRISDEVEAYLARRFHFSGIVMRLYQVIPPDISLRSLSIDRAHNVIIGGYAQSGASVNLFQTQLVASREFSDVTLQFTAKRKLYGQDLVEFKIQFKLRKTS